MTPLRTFIRGLAQVHRLEPSTPSLRLASSRAVAASSSRALIATQQARSFHWSRQLYQERQDAVDQGASSQPATTGESSGDSNNTANDPAPVARERADDDSTSAARSPGRPRKPQPWSGDRETSSYRREQTPRARGQSGPSSGNIRHDHRADWRSPEGRGQRWNDRRPQKEQRRDEDHGDENPPRQKEGWRLQKETLKRKFPEGWKPRKRLSPDALAGIRALNAQFPEVYTTETLSQKFEVSAESIRRILKSKWQPSPEEEQERQERWYRRGLHVWERKAALGIKPPKKWREEGVARDPEYHGRKQYGIQKRGEWEEEERERYRAGRNSRPGSNRGGGGL